MEGNKKNIYWLCTETLEMKNGTVAFKKDKKYKQISLKNDSLILENEKGEEHFLTYEWSMFFECIYDKK